MLAPRASGAFVCLRCELRRTRPRLTLFDRRASHTSFSSSSRAPDAADELEALARGEQSALKITREIQPLNRLRRRKGKVIRETSAKLGGLKRLGQDAEILVLQELGDTTPEEPAAKPVKPELLEVPNILASLQEDRDLTPEEINKQIESLRPKTHTNPDEPHYVTQTTFVKLIRILTDGFTHQQLSTFYSAAKNIQQEKVYKEVIDGLKGEKGTSKRPVERTEWQPGTTAISKRLPGLDLKYFRSRRKAVSKQLLVDRILRDVWNLVLLEEIEAPGELELSLKPWQITLLNTGENETMLNKIGRIRRAHLQVFQQHSVLRVTADKTTAEYAADDVEEALRNVQVKRLQLKPWIPYLDEKVTKDRKMISLYAPNDLESVSTLTRTSIQEAGDNMLIIRGLEKSAVEEAERLLLKILPLQDSSIYSVDTQILDAAKDSSYLLPIFQEEKFLDHTLRNVKIGRWSLPIARKSAAANTEDADSSEHLASEPDGNVKVPHSLLNRTVAAVRRPAEQTFKPTEEVGNWIPEPEFKLSAEFGQALFPLDHAGPNEAEKTSSKFSQSPFLPVFPGLSSLLTSDAFSATARMETPSLVYDFVPAPEQPDFEAGQPLPSLHIQMRTGRTGSRATLHKLSLGFQQRIHDVLLPDAAADIRFVQYGRLRFRKSHNDKNVQDWTEAVSANIESGGRLTAPSLSIDIPNWTIPGNSLDATGMSTITYLFSGIQFRQSVTGQFLGTSISYSTVQSGKLGAKAGMLHAYYNAYKDDGDALLQDEHKLKAFVRRCFIAVNKINDAAGQTQPVSKVIRPRSETSERKTKRLGQHVAVLETSATSAVAAASRNDTEASKSGEQDSREKEKLSGEGASLSTIDVTVQNTPKEDADTRLADALTPNVSENRPSSQDIPKDAEGIKDSKHD